jgi:menaquinone-dependent protoporphyrinogen oxidase
MSERVLIAYGSKHGSTAETAQAIAGMMRGHGLEVDVDEAAGIASVDGYDEVIIGGSIYTGRWHPDAKHFIRRFADELQEIPVAIFAMGPKTSEPDDLASAREQLDLSLKKLPDVGADPIAIFGGVIDPKKLHFPFSRLPATDARDWDAIGEFATRVSERAARSHAAGAGAPPGGGRSTTMQPVR